MAQPPVGTACALSWAGLRRLLALALALGMGCGATVASANSPVAEYTLKAALLFRLPDFVWGAEASSPGSQPYCLCLLGTDPFGAIADQLARTTLPAGRSMKFMRMEPSAPLTDCDMVFLARSESRQLATVLRRLAGTRAVTVSDIDGFARAGGMVELALAPEGQHVNLLINRGAAADKGLSFHAQLLRLARVVGP